MRLQFKVMDTPGKNLRTALTGGFSTPDAPPLYDRYFHRAGSFEPIRIILMPDLRIDPFAAIKELLKLRKNRLDIGHAL